MLTTSEAAARLGIHESTLARWVECGLVTRHAYNAHAYLYEVPDPHLPEKHCSRWDRLADRSAFDPFVEAADAAIRKSEDKRVESANRRAIDEQSG